MRTSTNDLENASAEKWTVPRPRSNKRSNPGVRKLDSKGSNAQH